MLAQVIQCVSLPPERRSEAMIDLVFPWFIKRAEIFSKLKPDAVKEIIKKCSLLETQRDDVIIRQGDKGEFFYIILKGNVTVYISQEPLASVEQNEEEEENDNKNDSKNDSKRQNKKNDNKKNKLERSEFGAAVGVIGAGKAFGELALLTEDCVRNASIIADENDCFLIGVHRELYNQVLLEAQRLDMNARLDFVHTRTPLFQSWPAKLRTQAAYSLRRQSFAFDTAVVRQGDPVNGLIFIVSGQAKIITDCPLHHTQFCEFLARADLQQSASAELKHQKDKLLYRLNEALKEPVTSRYQLNSESAMSVGQTAGELGRRRRHFTLPSSSAATCSASSAITSKSARFVSPYALAEQRHLQRRAEHMVVGAGEVIGDLEVVLGLPTYFSSIVCTQDTEVFVLDAENFDRLIRGGKKHAASSLHTMWLLQQSVGRKLRARRHRTLVCEAAGLVDSNANVDVPLTDYMIEEVERLVRVSGAAVAASSTAAGGSGDVTALAGDNVAAGGTANNQLKSEISATAKRNQHSTSDLRFIPPRGPIIDMYGKGTVFHRNKLRRQEKERTQKLIESKTENSKNDQTQTANQEESSGESEEDSDAELSGDENDSGRDSWADQYTQSQRATSIKLQDWESSSANLSAIEGRLDAWLQNLIRINASNVFNQRRSARSPFRSQTTNHCKLHNHASPQRWNSEMPSSSTLPADLSSEKSNLLIRLHRFKQNPQLKKIHPGMKVFLRTRQHSTLEEHRHATMRFREQMKFPRIQPMFLLESRQEAPAGGDGRVGDGSNDEPLSGDCATGEVFITELQQQLSLPKSNDATKQRREMLRNETRARRLSNPAILPIKTHHHHHQQEEHQNDVIKIQKQRMNSDGDDVRFQQRSESATSRLRISEEFVCEPVIPHSRHGAQITSSSVAAEASATAKADQDDATLTGRHVQKSNRATHTKPTQMNPLQMAPPQIAQSNKAPLTAAPHKQYSPDDYKELKERLRQKQIQLNAFRTSLTIF